MSSAATFNSRARALNLYRSLLKAHRAYLPREMRALGDNYVKAESKLHKTAKPEHLTKFYTEWESYLEEILKTARTRESLSMGAMVDPSAAQQTQAAVVFGKDLPKNLELQEEQRQQLEALKKEAEKLGRHGN